VEGDRRSPDAQAPGGAAESSCLGDGAERRELPKVHRYAVDKGEIFVLHVV
jgi:hypothetical protein